MIVNSSESDRWLARYGPWALVTGASDGIGREIARELAARRLNIILVARRADRLEVVASELRTSFCVECEVIPADLSERGAGAAVLEQVGDCDIGLLAACAGYGTSGRFLSVPLAEELGMLDVNCRAVLEMTHLIGEQLVTRGRGAIILMSSIVAFQGVPNAANYAATKAYIQSLSEGIRPELQAAGVEVLASVPGPVDSGFAARAGMRMGNAIDPADVAKETIAALGKSASVQPGLLSKVLIGALSTAPRFLRVKIMAEIMRGFTKHHATSR